MKRKLSLILAAVILLPTLVSCHGKMVSPESGSTDEFKPANTYKIPDEFDAERNYEITFWAKNDTNLRQVEIYHDAIAGFEAAYPNIKVTLRLYTDYSKIYQDVLTNIPTKTTPNVCITYPDHIATYMTGEDTVVPLGSLMSDEKYGLGGSEVNFDSPTKEEIIPKFLDECKLEDDYYALPYMRSTEACYVNKTYVEALGYTLPETLTWDFIWEVSNAAAKKDENGNFAVNGQKTLLPFIYKSTDNMMISMLKQLDAGYSSDDGSIYLFNDTTESILKTVRDNTASGAFSTFKISGYPANFLNAGQCIFAIDSTGGATWMGSNAPLIDISEENLVDFETVVMTIPQFDTENPKMISQGPSMCIFNKEDKQEVLASWLFMQYMLTNEVQISYSQTEGYVPVTSKAQNSAEYIDYLSKSGEDNNFYYDIKIAAAKLLIDNTDKTFTTPVFNGSTSLRSAAGQLIEEVVKSTRRNQTVDDAYIDALYEKMMSLYHLEQSEDINTGEISTLGNATGPLPGGAIALLSALGCAWLFIILYFIKEVAKKRKKS